MNPPPKWLTVGAPVVEYREHRNSSGRANLRRSTIDRIGKRDVVLANGERYAIKKLRREHGAWDSPTLLLSPDDERVAAAEAANLVSDLRFRADMAYDAWRRSRSSADAQALIDAVQACEAPR